jgi:hypothetical protein
MSREKKAVTREEEEIDTDGDVLDIRMIPHISLLRRAYDAPLTVKALACCSLALIGVFICLTVCVHVELDCVCYALLLSIFLLSFFLILLIFLSFFSFFFFFYS